MSEGLLLTNDTPPSYRKFPLSETECYRGATIIGRQMVNYYPNFDPQTLIFPENGAGFVGPVVHDILMRNRENNNVPEEKMHDYHCNPVRMESYRGPGDQNNLIRVYGMEEAVAEIKSRGHKEIGFVDDITETGTAQKIVRIALDHGFFTADAKDSRPRTKHTRYYTFEIQVGDKQYFVEMPLHHDIEPVEGCRIKAGTPFAKDYALLEECLWPDCVWKVYSKFPDGVPIWLVTRREIYGLKPLELNRFFPESHAILSGPAPSHERVDMHKTYEEWLKIMGVPELQCVR